MTTSLKIAQWNANGLSHHQLELISFIKNHCIDIVLISETHFTIKSAMTIPGYVIYDTKHPSGRAHGGTAVIVSNKIKHHELQKHNEDYLQATSIVVEDWRGPMTVSSIYCPPRHTISQEQYSDFFNGTI